MDHIGFKVENLESAKKDMEEIAVSSPGSGSRKIAIGRDGATQQKNLEACRLGCYATSDPDGVLLHFSD